MNIRATAISGAALIGLALTAPTSAIAAKADTSQSVTVFYGDLDPSSQAGAEALYLRLQGAARRVCLARMAHPRNRVSPPCYRQVLGKAVRDVKTLEVATLHARALLDKQSLAQVVSGSSTTALSK